LGINGKRTSAAAVITAAGVHLAPVTGAVSLIANYGNRQNPVFAMSARNIPVPG